MLVSVSLFRLRSATSGRVPAEPARTSHPAVGYLGTFNPEQLAAEQSYRAVYVPALRRLAGLDRYLIGRVFTQEGRLTRYSHMAVLYWQSRAAWEGAMRSGVSERLGIPAVGEWVETVETYAGDLAEVPPTEPPQPQGLLGIWLLKLLPTPTPEQAERYYREVYAPYERQRPGVRQYWIGPTLSLRPTPPRHSHLALIEYENWSALQQAGPADTPPSWIRPMAEWCAQCETYFTEFEEVPRG